MELEWFFRRLFLYRVFPCLSMSGMCRMNLPALKQRFCGPYPPKSRHHPTRLNRSQTDYAL